MRDSFPLARWRARATQWFLDRVLRAPPDFTFVPGGRPRPFAPTIRIESRQIWAAEPLSRKLRALLRLRWRPDDTVLYAQGYAAFRDLYFGGDEDCAADLARLNDWHFAREWQLDALGAGDRERADALAAFTVQTRLRYQRAAVGPATVQLGIRTPEITDLIYPMVAKTPVLSMRYFLELHAHYAFDAVRRARHPHADEVIAFLYELLFLQQKVAVGLLGFVEHLAYAEAEKGEARLLRAEADAMVAADGLFANLKASVEKTIALVGVTHGLLNLDAKPNHKARVKALRDKLPDIEDRFYAQFLFEMVGPEHLEDLNNYRTGLLHKKGAADLQPHNYVGQPADATPLRKVLGVAHEQHAKNTALLLVALALLTDDLVQRDRPLFALTDIPGYAERVRGRVNAMAERAEAAITEEIDRARGDGPADQLGRLHAARGGARRHLGRARDALADFEAALAHGVPDPEDVHYNVGLALMDLDDDGKDAAAVAAFTRAIALAPDESRAYLGRAFAHENLGDLPSAAADLDVVIPLVAAPAALLEKRAGWRLRLGRYTEALADLDAAAAHGHVTLDTLTWRGQALLALGDHEAAIAALTDAIERHPTAVAARVARATAFLVRGQDVDARIDLDRVVERAGDHRMVPTALSVRAALRAESGDRVGAIADLEDAIARCGPVPPEDLVAFLAELRGEAKGAVEE